MRSGRQILWFFWLTFGMLWRIFDESIAGTVTRTRDSCFSLNSHFVSRHLSLYLSQFSLSLFLDQISLFFLSPISSLSVFSPKPHNSRVSLTVCRCVHSCVCVGVNPWRMKLFFFFNGGSESILWEYCVCIWISLSVFLFHGKTRVYNGCL